jgi:hypothetical protein
MLYSGLIAFLEWRSEPCGLRHSLSGRDDRGTGSHSDVQYVDACRRDHCADPRMGDRAMGNHQ